MSPAHAPDLTALRGTPALAGLADAELAELFASASRVRARDGDELIHEGVSRVEKMGLFFLTDGAIRVLKRGRQLADLGPGAVVGEIELLTRLAPTATVRAVGDATLYWIGRDAIDSMLARGSLAVHKLCGNLARVLAQRLRAADERLVDAGHPGAVTGEIHAAMLTGWKF